MSKRILHRALLFVYRVLIALKRALWKGGSTVLPRLGKGSMAVLRPMLFTGYRAYSWLRHKLKLEYLPFEQRAFEIVVHPRFLFAVVFLFIIALLFPHTKLYSRSQLITPGQESVLLSLIGPGEEYFVEESIGVAPDPALIGQWDAGAARLHTPDAGAAPSEQPGDLGALAVGGTAITKPSILSGEHETRTRTAALTYVVQPGDTIGGIAQAYGVSVNTILWENDLTFRSYIRPGQQLTILPASGVSHTVKSGDTLTKLARTYKVEIEDIMNANRLAGASSLSIGQNLFIPGGTRSTFTATPAPSPAGSAFRHIAAPPPSISVPAGTNYLWPAEVKRVTQYYGWRHTGVDIAGPAGTPVYAARAGRVIYEQCGWNGGYGCNIRIDHGNGVVTLYAHHAIDKHYVKVGDWVEQGQVIAGMGSTGQSTGPHLHFEVRVNGSRENPLKYVRL